MGECCKGLHAICQSAVQCASGFPCGAHRANQGFGYFWDVAHQNVTSLRQVDGTHDEGMVCDAEKSLLLLHWSWGCDGATHCEGASHLCKANILVSGAC